MLERFLLNFQKFKISFIRQKKFAQFIYVHAKRVIWQIVVKYKTHVIIAQ